MKKQTVAILLIVALLLAVGCFGIYGYIQTKNNEIKNTPLFSCKASDIVEYGVKTGEEDYVLIKENDEWRVKDNSVAVLDSKKVQETVNSASMIMALGILKDRELKEFDATDVRELSLALSDGTSCNIKFVGEKAEICAIKLNDSEDIYAIRTSVRDILIAPLAKFRASVLFDGLMGEDAPLEYYSFKDFDKTETVIRTKTSVEISNSKKNRYIMEKPYRKDVDDEQFEQLIGVKIPRLAAEKYEDEISEDKEIYGLDENSRATLRFRWGEFDESLYLGATEGGLVYAEIAGRDGIFMINSTQLEFLHTEPFYLLESGMLRSDLENISGVTVKTAENEYKIESRNRKENNKEFFVNGKTASETAFNAVVEIIGGIKIRSEVVQDVKNSGDVIITVHFDNGVGTQNISLSAMNDKEYAAFMGGKAEFAVDRETIDALLLELDKISKNPIKTDEKG
ncbi:MAG: DUF4340 domain-containing protein [Clostridia bacterium]|nr:DUF4340 domain-containing protein [Clostridia bacterium]